MESSVSEGGCLCGGTRYRLMGRPISSGLCHCRTCRRTASAPVLPFSTWAKEAFAWTAALPATFPSSSNVQRTFCSTCGSPLTYFNEADPGAIDVMTCSLDDPEAVPPTFSVWSSEALAWHGPDPNLPSFPRGRNEGQTT